MDPQHRLVLERGYASLHASGSSKPSLMGSLVGVAVGIYATEFALLIAETPLGRSVYASTNTLSVACGRVSFVLGLHGQCASFDTACSASLVACHFSAHAIQNLECRSHLVVGVNMMLLQASSIGMASAGMTSIAGRSHTFDRRADGFARGEGVSSTVLATCETTLPQVKGRAVRQDGRSASLTAPNGHAQQEMLRAALANAQTHAAALTLIEAHGTGTALGDPIESGSILDALLSEPRGPSVLAAGSMKANLCHGESTAGATGLLRVCLGLQNIDTVPNAQLRALNPNIGIRALRSRATLALATQLTSAALTSRFIVVPDISGGVSSFGYAGTIAHVVLSLCVEPSIGTQALQCSSHTKLDYRRAKFGWTSPIMDMNHDVMSLFGINWLPQKVPHTRKTCSTSMVAIQATSTRMQERSASEPCTPLSVSSKFCHSGSHQLHADVCIIGGGLSGVCIARDLAASGYTCIIVERAGTIEGSCIVNKFSGVQRCRCIFYPMTSLV